MYLTGGPSQFLAKLPDDGQEVDYDIELVSVVGIRDIFGALVELWATYWVALDHINALAFRSVEENKNGSYVGLSVAC